MLIPDIAATVSDPNALQKLFELLLAYVVVGFVVCIVLYILQVIANWRIFTKAGEAGWKSIIPLVNSYTSFKIAWKTVYFWLSLLGVIATTVGYSLLPAVDGSTAGSPAAMPLICCGLIVAGVLNIVFCVKLSKAFGHGVGFALGLIFLNPVFLLILGLGGSQYVGADN